MAINFFNINTTQCVELIYERCVLIAAVGVQIRVGLSDQQFGETNTLTDIKKKT
jgi:hypothetical protein